MTIAQWSDDYKTGEKEIDKEHWGLFALINDLNEKRLHGADEKSIASTLYALVAYVDVHFEHEERLMEETGYPELDSHKKAHEALDRRVMEFQDAFLGSPETFDFEALMDFLSNWLQQHILKLDMDFAAYHKKRQGEGGSA
ncbi:MAG: hemerythrin family protein [Rhodospirillales bacterium]|nr:hemerythrin family protein [Alphaproteobacteria bacterium]MBL6948138.1 hemerythrin family protein [Rhodospirillales bacterium]